MALGKEFLPAEAIAVALNVFRPIRKSLFVPLNEIKSAAIQETCQRTAVERNRHGSDSTSHCR